MEQAHDLGNVGSDVLELAVADATRAIDQQSAKLEEHRGRAATILTGGSIVASFLGTAVLDRIDSPVYEADRDIRVLVAASIGLIAFVVVAFLAGFTLRPSKGWAFGRSPAKLISFVTHPATINADAYRRFTLEDLADDHARNELRLQPLTNAVRRAVYALAAETVGFLIALM